MNAARRLDVGAFNEDVVSLVKRALSVELWENLAATFFQMDRVVLENILSIIRKVNLLIQQIRTPI